MGMPDEDLKHAAKLRALAKRLREIRDIPVWEPNRAILVLGNVDVVVGLMEDEAERLGSPEMDLSTPAGKEFLAEVNDGIRKVFRLGNSFGKTKP